jgi:cation transport regulator ChaC
MMSPVQGRPDGEAAHSPGDATMAERFYFAYGSNLNSRDWHAWCRRKGYPPGMLRFHSIGHLPDFELAFDYRSTSRDCGVLDLRHQVGQLTDGVIFEVRKGGWGVLDTKEGAPTCYVPRPVTVLTPSGEALRARTYIVRKECREGFVPPSRHYVEVVRAGLAEHDLPDMALEVAARGAHPQALDGLFVYGTLLRGEGAFHRLEPFGLECTLLAETPGR